VKPSASLNRKYLVWRKEMELETFRFQVPFSYVWFEVFGKGT